MSYTVHEDPAIRTRIDRDMDRIVRTVQTGDPQLKALVLTGGFGRGEGTVINGEPQNDYDFVAIRRAGSSRPYPEMAQELATRIGLPIDLHPVWAPRLPWVGRSIFWYETALRGRVLFGDPNILRRIRINHESRISRGEPMRLLANRAAGLLLACEPDDRAKSIQACKALLAVVDAHLLIHGTFPPTHVERWEIHQKMAKEDRLPPRLRGLSDVLTWAYLYKTNPALAPPMDASIAWLEAATAILESVPSALRYCGAKDLDEYAQKDTWGERLHYWLRGRGDGPWMSHPSSQARVLTLQTLEAKQFPQRSPHTNVARNLEALQTLRHTTLQ